MKLTLLRNSYPLFTERTKAEIEKDTRSEPFDLESFFEALDVENVSTATSDTR